MAAERVAHAVSPGDPGTGSPRGRRPLLGHSPFHLGFFGALGALTAIFLTEQLLSISSILILIVLAMFLAVGLNPLVEWFMRRGLGRGWSVGVVLLVVLSALTVLVLTIAPVTSEQVAQISANAPGWLDDIQKNDQVQSLDDQFDLISRIRDYVEKGDFGQQVFGGVLGVGMAVLSAVANTIIVLVLMIYFLASLPTIKSAAYRLAPSSRRPRVTDLGDRIIGATGSYVAGAFVVALCAGVSTLIFTFVIGLGDYAFALAFVVGLLSLIPVVGSVISAVIITALGLTISPTVALICLVYYLAYQQLEAYVIYPKIMTRSVDVPGSVTVVSALAGGALLGVVGALLAVPTAAAILLLTKEVHIRRQDER